ncbi:Fur family transcriptional regulator [Bartonella sp. Raccoon60]|uniref:Fur family transcriptional regulator n=1 Tax=Bartonella sp. Raccoon60 TaxID=1933912 RepID=UPI000999C6F3|nr:Fur family transcriptional regulator [Bartonella sp. Raccoon60]AQX26244.1 manganese uptake regulator, Fur family [Bartonella sp. Raccoon60]
MNKQTYEKELRIAGLRVTRQRCIIFDVLADTDDHPNAFEIFQRVHKIDPSISLSTVYRTMKTLEENGTIHRHIFNGGPSRFEQAKGEHHDHLIDIDTGEAIEFHSAIIEKLQEEIAHSLGYDIVYHRLEIYGKKRNS